MMMVKFPTSIKPKYLLLQVVVMYALFCFDSSNYFGNKVYNYTLFCNDFSQKGEFAWFVSAIETAMFLFIISYAACVYSADRLAKSIFFAISIDSVFTILNTIMFGYYEHISAIVVRNLFIILALLFAYFILFTPNDTRRPNTRDKA